MDTKTYTIKPLPLFRSGTTKQVGFHPFILDEREFIIASAVDQNNLTEFKTDKLAMNKYGELVRKYSDEVIESRKGRPNQLPVWANLVHSSSPVLA